MQEILDVNLVYGLPRSVAVFHELSDVFGPLKCRGQGLSTRVLTPDATTADVPYNSDQLVFFKVVRHRPAKGKHVYGAFATNSWFEHGDIAVSFHQSHYLNGEVFVDNRPLIATGASSCLAALRLRPEHLQMFEDQLQVRDLGRGKLTFSCMGLCTPLIQDLVSS